MSSSDAQTRVSEHFHPAVGEWFRRRFPAGPTEAQAAGWPAIQRGEDTLIAAPTGSGKTLAAFLVQIDKLYRAASAGTLRDGVHVVYVSPLKALVLDIYENLERPLAEIAQVATEMGLEVPLLRVGMRSGDTPMALRAELTKQPPHILVTTPESLYLLLTAAKSRPHFAGVQSVIVDEIHALARDKRGVHLSLTLERLCALCEQAPARVGLSATQRPLSRIARLLVGNARSDERGEPSCTIVDRGHRRKLELSLELPNRELEAVSSTEHLHEVLDLIAGHVARHTTTLVFTNNRRLSERLAHLLASRVGEGLVAAHHGSLAKERRLLIEQRLKRGELKVLVATASLELGIDIGPVELVCQIGSPRSIATFLQRVGRSGHTRFGTPKGILYPLTRDELVECAALLRAVGAGRLDSIVFPSAPLDILAQQIVAECAAQSHDEDELFELVRRAAPYESLTREVFDRIVDLMSEGIVTGRGKRAWYLHRDALGRRVHARKGARLAALTSGGAIGDTADYRVLEEPGDTFVGTINEDFAIESMAGDVFLLGSTSWRIRRVERGIVRVVNAEGATPTIPFWLGEAPARTSELSEEVAALRGAVEREFEAERDVASWVMKECGLELPAANALVEYLNVARKELGLLPTQDDIVVERFFDETGGMQLVVHAPFGGRVNRGLGLLMRKRFCRSFDFELQAAANDDALILSLGPQHSFPLDDINDFFSPHGVIAALQHAVLVTPMFQTRWRWNLNRALVVLRRKGGRQNPPQIQRMEADDVTAAVFPSLAACQDNATGPREIPEHPLVQQTLADCLSEAIDVAGLSALLQRIKDGEVRVHFRDTTEPSVLGHEILNGRPYTFLDDAPLEERRTRAVQLRRGLPLEARNLGALDPEAILRVRAEVQVAIASVEELHEYLVESVVCAARDAWREQFTTLRAAGRAFVLWTDATERWVAVERLAAARTLFADARWEAPARDAQALDPNPNLEPDTLAQALLRVVLDGLGPTSVTELCVQSGLTESSVRSALALLEQSGFVLSGQFDPGVTGLQYCSRRLLSRIHGYTQQRLRREIEPVSAQDYLRFLLDYHGLTRDSQRRGSGGLMRSIEQLQGFEAAASAWETELLPARVQGFSQELLDALCWSGDVVWGRLTLRAQQSEQAWVNFSRVTPISLALREDFAWLLAAVRGAMLPVASSRPEVNCVVDVLSRRGASFFNELAEHCALSSADLQDALWENVARGLVTSDGYSALRALLGGPTSTVPRLINRAVSSLRRGVRGNRPREGRWALLEPHKTDYATDELAEAVAEQLLLRYGVVFRDLIERESFSVPWRDVLWALRRFEARGTIRGGRFVNGFVGEQYALPEAIEELRQVRRTPLSGEIVSVSACDPLNLVGIIVPGKRVAAQRGNRISYRDGVALDETPSALTSSYS
jgi:ATP-dependent Lhr-like helicase